MNAERYVAPALVGLALVGLALAGLALAGCSGAAPSGGGGAAPGAVRGSASAVAVATSAHAGAVHDVKKACALLSPQDIKAATGVDVTAGQIGDSQAGLWVECRYAYVSDSLSIVRVQLATPANATGFFDAAKQDVTNTSMSVPGADDARWGSAFGTVYVVKGGVSFFVQISDSNAVDQAKTKALAQLALANTAKLG